MIPVLHVGAVLGAVFLIAVVMRDAFETVVLPRRVSHRGRLAQTYFQMTWRVWSTLARRLRSAGRREAVLAIYGPMALLVLLIVWIFLLVLGFALLYWALESHLDFGTDFYFSGTTFLTLGLGDVVPQTSGARTLTVVEVGTGFGMLALTIGYLPVLYQAFSRREVSISLLDGHAGSPPTAEALLHRHPPNRRAARLTMLLADWEHWAAELLESNLSYPVLAYYRTQHDSQSWVAALTAVLDSCALILAASAHDVDDELTQQAAFTFVIARHVAVDLSQVFGVSPQRGRLPDRLAPADWARLDETLAATGLLAGESTCVDELKALRALYEPYMTGLADYLVTPLPPWVPLPDALDDWQTPHDVLPASLASRVREVATRGFSRGA